MAQSDSYSTPVAGLTGPRGCEKEITSTCNLITNQGPQRLRSKKVSLPVPAAESPLRFPPMVVLDWGLSKRVRKLLFVSGLTSLYDVLLPFAHFTVYFSFVAGLSCVRVRSVQLNERRDQIRG